MYAAPTELLTQTANRESTEMNIFSIEKPNTKPGTRLPSNTNNTYNSLLCLGTVSSVSLYTPSAEIQWEQGRFYQESFVSFGKRRTVWTVTLVPLGAPRKARYLPGRPPQSCPCPERWLLPSLLLQWHHPTFSSFTFEIHGMKHQGQ